ncbi:Major facilitator superfamily domain-containing protein 1 [Cichlidogyrus casuarinus]|uniref:Lysosomal dipeptide transporter MFSD1 n=1 Tax=Cichlidogyrus casuarinus TaxID=1844966 RepID=A0ABD2Q5G9_9PLAT
MDYNSGLLNTEDDDDQYEDGCSRTLACDPRRKLHRFLVLFFISFLAFGSYFCFDIPAAMQDVFIKDLRLDSQKFMNLYSFYSWPNVFVCFIGGFLVDRVFGLQVGGILFSGLVLIAQVVFGLGTSFNNIPLMYIGRLILGIGGETLATVQNAYCISWYSSSEVTFVFGLQMSIARFGSTVTMNVMMPIYNALKNSAHFGGPKVVGYTQFIAALFCLFSMLCTIFLAYFDRRSKRILRSTAQAIEVSDHSLENEETVKVEEDKIQLKDVLTFPTSYWLICIIIVCYYVSVFPFIGLGVTYFEKKYGLTPTMAGFVNSLSYIVSAVASPLLGAMIDFTGCNLLWIALSVLLTLFVHCMFAFNFTVPPLVLMILLGFGYSILASIWPLVGLLIPGYQLGTAYGMLQAVQNLGLAVIAMAAGAILDSSGYFMVELFFIAWLVLTLAAVVALYFVDLSRGSLLNASGKRRRREAREREAAANPVN